MRQQHLSFNFSIFQVLLKKCQDSLQQQQNRKQLSLVTGSIKILLWGTRLQFGLGWVASVWEQLGMGYLGTILEDYMLLKFLCD